MSLSFSPSRSICADFRDVSDTASFFSFTQGHQAFFTEDALTAISEVTLGNLALYVRGRAAALQSPNECTHTAAAPLPKKQTFAHESVLKAKL